jgi:hypothetical protein
MYIRKRVQNVKVPRAQRKPCETGNKSCLFLLLLLLPVLLRCYYFKTCELIILSVASTVQRIQANVSNNVCNKEVICADVGVITAVNKRVWSNSRMKLKREN